MSSVKVANFYVPSKTLCCSRGNQFQAGWASHITNVVIYVSGCMVLGALDG